jgi:alpha-beta hydrolase superfamily lysophospholipase
MSNNQETSSTPSSEQLAQTKRKIDAYIQSVKANPNYRSGSEPCYRFHNAGEPVQGTTIIFHGFGGKPPQSLRLADYLFKNGFNVYQPNIAGHTLKPPAKFWSQVDLKPEIWNPLREKVQKDPILQNYIASLPADPSLFKRPDPTQQKALVARLLLLEPRLLDIVKAVEEDNDPDFQRYFISSHMDYLTDAQARLADLEAMPGPISTIGLSVGGAIALGLAGDKPNRIGKCVAYAPLLKIYDPERERYINLTGPLDIYEKSWDPTESFPVGALTATAHFGAYVRQRPNVRSLRKVKIFMVLTENEDAAHIPTNQKLFNDIGGESRGNSYYIYPASDLVPHPMLDPTTVSQGMTNRFWQSLYQETLRFLTTGDIDPSNMSSLEQDPNLPQVPPL